MIYFKRNAEVKKNEQNDLFFHNCVKAQIFAIGSLARGTLLVLIWEGEVGWQAIDILQNQQNST